MKRSSASRGMNKRKKVADLAGKDVGLLVKEAVEFFTSDDQRSGNVTYYLKILESAGRTVGLLVEDITALMDVIIEDRFSQSVRKRLIHCLVPTSCVNEDAVVDAICWVTFPGFPVVMQVELMKWMCAIFPYISSKVKIQYLYSTLFTLLENDSVRPYLCEFLYKLTREEHVLSYRIRRLIDLQSRVGSESHVLALLQLYASYRPDLVVIHCKFKRKVFKSLGQLPLYVSKVKHTTAMQTYVNNKIETMVLTKDITMFSDLSEVIQDLKGNDGIVKLLNSPLRRILLSSNLPDTFLIQLRLFVRTSLFTEVAWTSSSLNDCSRGSLLPLLSGISSELREGMPDVFMFLANYMKVWDGQKCLHLILNLIQFWEICPFHDLLETILKPIYKLFCYSSVDFKCSVFQCFMNLYKNWVLYEAPRVFARTENLVASPAQQKQITIFDRDSELFDSDEQIQALATYIEQLCVVSLQIHPDHPPILLYHILKFYEMALLVRQYHRSTALCIPAPSITCACFFSMNPAILSQTCHLVCKFREEVYIMRRNANSSIEFVPKLNSYISDICNMLVLRSAFTTKDKTVFFQNKLPASVKKTIYKVRESFSIHRHPALLGVALSYIRNVRDELSPNMLLMDSRMKESYLQYMESQGFTDVTTFLQTFVKTMHVPSDRDSYSDA